MSHPTAASSDRWPRDREREDVQRERERQARERAQLVEGQHDTPNQPIFGEPIKVDPKREDEMSRRIENTLGEFQKLQRYFIDDPKTLIGISRSTLINPPQKGMTNAVNQSRLPANPYSSSSTDNNVYKKPTVVNGQHKSSLVSNHHQTTDYSNGVKQQRNKEGNNNWNGSQGKAPVAANAPQVPQQSSSSSSTTTASSLTTTTTLSSSSASSNSVHSKGTEQNSSSSSSSKSVHLSSSLGDVRRHGKHNSQPDRTTTTCVPPPHHQKGSSRVQQQQQQSSHKSVASADAGAKPSRSGAQSSSSADKNALSKASVAAKSAEPADNNSDEYLEFILREMTSFPSPVSAIVTPEREEAKEESPLGPLESSTNASNKTKPLSANCRTKNEHGSSWPQINLDHDLSVSSDSEEDADTFTNKGSSSLPPEIKSVHNEIYHPPSPIEGMSSSSDSSSSGSEESSSGSDSEESDSSISSNCVPEQATKAPTESWSLINFVERTNSALPRVDNAPSVCSVPPSLEPIRPNPVDSSKHPFSSLADGDSFNCMLTNYSNNDIKEYFTSSTHGSLDLEPGDVDLNCEPQPLLSPLRSPCIRPQASPSLQDDEVAATKPQSASSEWSFCETEEKAGSGHSQRSLPVLKIRLIHNGGGKSSRSSDGHKASYSHAPQQQGNDAADRSSQQPDSTPSYDHLADPSVECKGVQSSSPLPPPPPVVVAPPAAAAAAASSHSNVPSSSAPSLADSKNAATSSSSVSSSSSKGSGEGRPKKHSSATHKPGKERDRAAKKESAEQKGHSQKRSSSSSKASGQQKASSSANNVSSKSSSKAKNASKKDDASSQQQPQHPPPPSSSSSERKPSREGQERKSQKSHKIKSKEIISDSSSGSDSEGPATAPEPPPPAPALPKLQAKESHKEPKQCISSSSKAKSTSSCDKPSTHSSKKAKVRPSKELHAEDKTSSSHLSSITEVINSVATGECHLDDSQKAPLPPVASDVECMFTKSSVMKLEPPLSPIPNGFTPAHQHEYKEHPMSVVHSLPVQIKLSMLERVPSHPLMKDLYPPVVNNNNNNLKMEVAEQHVRSSSAPSPVGDKVHESRTGGGGGVVMKVSSSPPPARFGSPVPPPPQQQQLLLNATQQEARDSKQSPSVVVKSKAETKEPAVVHPTGEKAAAAPATTPDERTKAKSTKRKLEDSSKGGGSEKKHKSSTKSSSSSSSSLSSSHREKTKASRKLPAEAPSEADANQWENKMPSGGAPLVRCGSASSISSFSSQKSQSRTTSREKDHSGEGGGGGKSKSKHSESADKAKRSSSSTPSLEKEGKRRDREEKKHREKKDSSRDRSKEKSSGSSNSSTKDGDTSAKASKKPKIESCNTEGSHVSSSQVATGGEEASSKADVKSTKAASAREVVATTDNQPSQPEKKSQAINNKRIEHSSGKTYMTPSELNAKLHSTESTLAEAKSLKREADKEEDKTLQIMKYVKAVIYFTLTGMSMELTNTDVNRTYQMFKETNNLIRHITSKFLRIENYASYSYVDSKLAVLSLRCQSLLYQRMYLLRRLEAKECQRTISDFQRSSIGRAISQPSPVPPTLQTPSSFRLSHPSPCQPRTGSNGGTSGVPSPHSPTPSPAGSVASVGSQSSGYSSSELGAIPGRSSGGSTGSGSNSQSYLIGGGGSHSSGGGSGGSIGGASSFSHMSSVQSQQSQAVQQQQQQPGMVSIPEHIYNVMQKQINLLYNLHMCYDLWDQADHLANRTQSKDFFKELESDCGHLTLESTFIQLFHYVYTGLERLEGIYRRT